MTLPSSEALTDFRFPNEIIELFNEAAVQNVNEAVAVLLHAFVLEARFDPKDVPHADVYKMMPKDWNKKTFFRIKYSHDCCPLYTCLITYIPLYDNFSIKAIICDTACSESIILKISVSKYLKQKIDLSNVYDVFKVDELSLYFKDNFCLPLLNLLHGIIPGKCLYGLPSLYEDLQLTLLSTLPVESVVSISAVNKNWHNLANSHIIWKYLFYRDYSKDGVHDIKTTSKTDWKELYKAEYLKRNRKPMKRDLRMPYYFRPVPPILNLPPDLDTDFDIGFDPPFPGLSSYYPPLPPFLLPRLPPQLFRRL